MSILGRYFRWFLVIAGNYLTNNKRPPRFLSEVVHFVFKYSLQGFFRYLKRFERVKKSTWLNRSSSWSKRCQSWSEIPFSWSKNRPTWLKRHSNWMNLIQSRKTHFSLFPLSFTCKIVFVSIHFGLVGRVIDRNAFWILRSQMCTVIKPFCRSCRCSLGTRSRGCR